MSGLPRSVFMTLLGCVDSFPLQTETVRVLFGHWGVIPSTVQQGKRRSASVAKARRLSLAVTR